MTPDTDSKPAWETSSRTTNEHQVSLHIPTAIPGINQLSHLDRLTLPPQKNTLNNKELKKNPQ
jgi:hypothetical protein